jgi:ABC-type transporter Mla MlaB component
VAFRLSRVVSGERVTFRFSGELTRTELAEIAATVARELDGAIAFDLADLTMASREGIEYLQQAAARGTELVNCPPYISRWIEAEE